MVKLTYEQMRHLAELGDGGKLTVKNREGKVLKPTLKKWGPNANPKATRSTCMEVPQKPNRAPTASHSQTSQQVFSSPLQRPQVKR